MTARKNAFKVGVVTILVTALACAILIWISKGIGGDTQPITIRFKSSPAMPTLAPGSDVLVGGQKVGTVSQARLVPEDPPTQKPGTPPNYFVMVEADILSKLHLRKDCKVIAEGPPLGGAGVLKIDLGIATDPLPEGSIIEGADPAGFAAILAGIQDEFDASNPDGLLGQIKAQLNPDTEKTLMGKLLISMEDVNVMTTSLRAELSESDKANLMAKLHEVVDHINDTTSALRNEFSTDKPDVLLAKIHVSINAVNQTLTTLAEMVKANRDPLDRTVANIDKTAANIASETDPNNMDGLMASIKNATRSLNLSLADINVVTATTREITVLNKETINRMLVNFKEASDHLKSGVKYVLRHPYRLLKEPSVKEVREEYVFDAARSFSEAATRIDDAAAQLRALSELHNGRIPVDNPDLQKLAAELQQTRDRYQQAQTELWNLLGRK